MKSGFGRLVLFLLGVVLVGCGGGTEALPTRYPTAVPPPAGLTLPPTPFVTRSAAADAPTPLPTATPLPPTPEPETRLGVAADTAVPPELAAAAQAFSDRYPDTFRWVEPTAADVLLTVGEGRPLAQWVYAAAAPFATVPDGISWAEIQAGWQTGAGEGWRMIVGEETAVALTPLLGEPGADPAPAAELAAAVWAGRPARTILPFDRLTPDLKVLALDGVSPLAADFAVDGYPLVVEVGVTGEGTAVSQFLSLWDGPRSNRDPAKMTTVAMTGVTALVRATAYQMELNGVLYPGEEVGPVMQAADIAHVSNEVAFAPDCPYPNPVGGTTFCSRDSYFALLEAVGADVIELTGNHVNDWGAENLTRSIEMYEAAGMKTFGGGRNSAAAAAAALFEHNGNRIAFVGCNPVGPAYAWAGEASAGSRPCDGAMAAQIGELRAAGAVVIATLQYNEFYQYAPTAQQKADFRALVDAGATAVSGSQGHHAQGFDVTNGGFIHYGPGNLFFDQMDMLGTRQTFVDTYTIYDGRLLSVSLWTGLIENWSRPRVMTPAERAAALTAVFQASGWGP